MISIAANDTYTANITNTRHMYNSTVPNTNSTMLILMVIRLKITSTMSMNKVTACSEMLIQKSIGDRCAIHLYDEIMWTIAQHM